MEFDEKRLRRWTDPLEGFIDAGPLQDCLAELTRLRKIEAAAREVIAGEMPHECWHPELREALGEAL